MKLEQQDLLRLQTSADGGQNRPPSGNDVVNDAEDGKGEELMEREQIAGTPFWCIGNRIDGYFLAFGQHRMGPVLEEKQGVLDYLNTNMWDVVGYLCSVISELIVKDTLNKQKD